MQTFIIPHIVLNKAVKNKCFSYSIVLDQKRLTRLTIKAKSADGRGRGNVGYIEKDGTAFFKTYSSYEAQVAPLLTKKVRDKISFTLDHLYGMDRNKKCIFNEKGLVVSNLISKKR